MKEYYDQRAPEYDDWWIWSSENREGWADELEVALAAVNALPAARTLDVACGTGYMTQYLEGDVVGTDQSGRVLEIARERLPDVTFVQSDAFSLPFDAMSFGRVFASYFYCHLEAEDAMRFREEARRLAPELVVMGSRWNGVDAKNRWEERQLSDGSTWPVYKRVFDPDELVAELDGELLHAGTWFVVVRAA